MNNAIKVIVAAKYYIIGVLLGIFLCWTFDYLQLENADGYAEYKKARSAYESYLKKYGKEPCNINFLPEDIRENIGKHDYPIKFIEETGNLTYKYPRPYPYGKSNLIDYIFCKKMVVGSIIGHIDDRNCK